MTVYRGCPAYWHKLAEASKKINENKFSAVANKFRHEANTELPPSSEKTALLVAEVLSKIRTVLNTMSYSDLVNIVSNTASRIFNEKNDGQKIYDSIKNANTAPVISKQTNNLEPAETFCKMDKRKIFQWNCRGLNNKKSHLILFSVEDIDVICLNEVKNWKKSTPLNNCVLRPRSSWLCNFEWRTALL